VCVFCSQEPTLSFVLVLRVLHYMTCAFLACFVWNLLWILVYSLPCNGCSWEQMVGFYWIVRTEIISICTVIRHISGIFCSASSLHNMEHVFEVGKEVEARFNEIGYRGAWFRCKVYSMTSSLCFLDHRLESLSLLHQCAILSHFKSSLVCNMWQILESRRSGEEWEYLLYYLDFTEESKYMACS
jgi:hypothetical protein